MYLTTFDAFAFAIGFFTLGMMAGHALLPPKKKRR
jgi:hypothetical protein